MTAMASRLVSQLSGGGSAFGTVPPKTLTLGLPGDVELFSASDAAVDALVVVGRVGNVKSLKPIILENLLNILLYFICQTTNLICLPLRLLLCHLSVYNISSL